MSDDPIVYYDCCDHCEHDPVTSPADQHRRPCPEGCNDDE